MKIYLMEYTKNINLHSYLKSRYNVTNNIYNADVVIVYKVYDIKRAFEIVDYSLSMGKEIICIKNSFSKESYISNYLIKNGASYV